MDQIVQVRPGETTYVPAPWAGTVPPEAGIQVFDLVEPTSASRALRTLQRGGWLVARGAWAEIAELLDAAAVRAGEAARPAPRHRATRRRGHQDPRLEAQRRILMTASTDGWLDTQPPVHLPHLLELLGDRRDASEGLPLLFPALAVRELMATLDERYPVRALGAELVAPKMVLQPRQQEVYDLLQSKLLALRESLPPNLAALDMGCGSGALALLLARLLEPLRPAIWATDTLPEALASTRLNLDRLVTQGLVRPEAVRVTDGGDLYEPLGELAFDLIVFNPPWANARPRTRLEVARFDFGQHTLRRFLEATPAHLRPGGHLLLFYADNAGPKALEGVRAAAEEAGLRIADALSKRIRVARRWEHIYLYDVVEGAKQ